MTERKSLVAANWKMNGTLETLRPLLVEVLEGLGSDCEAEVAVCTPSIYLPEVQQLLADSDVVLGAQNVSEQDAGAYTGEISVSMLKDYGCQYVIVGHSERRAIYNESDELVAKKFAKVYENGLVPILCLGEQLEEREAGTTEEVVSRQLDAVINKAGIAAFANAVIAYEPVWAIGTGKTATSEQAQEVHAFIRLSLARNDDNIADHMRILYGGSVKAGNAKEIFSMADVDGGLIGGASLIAEDFITICQSTR